MTNHEFEEVREIVASQQAQFAANMARVSTNLEKVEESLLRMDETVTKATVLVRQIVERYNNGRGNQ